MGKNLVVLDDESVLQMDMGKGSILQVLQHIITKTIRSVRALWVMTEWTNGPLGERMDGQKSMTSEYRPIIGS